MKLIDIIEKEKEQNPDGTFAALKFSAKTKKMIQEYIKENNIPNPIATDKIHSTLLYSRNYLPDYEPLGKFEKAWIGKPKHFSIFGLDPENSKNCLVLEYECAEQSKRFKYLMKVHDATYDFDEYKPHITISYDIGDLDSFEHEKLPKIEEPLEIVEEFGEDLELD